MKNLNQKGLNKLWRTPKFFDRLNYESKMKTVEGQGVGVCSLTHNTSKVKERARASDGD
jgi:hypothetical protein